jgi:hypothetical protein
MTRLWYERQPPTPKKVLFSAADAFDVFRGLLVETHIYEDNERQAVDRFNRSCTILYNRNLLRLAIVQYTHERNRPFQPFRTDLGYIKSLYDPKPFMGLRHAQSVQTSRRRISSAR